MQRKVPLSCFAKYSSVEVDNTNMFQIICKSNDSLNYYPDNKSNNFRVKILPLANKGYNNLEVGLVEIIIPSKQKNVRNGFNSIDIVHVGIASTSYSEEQTWIEKDDPHWVDRGESFVNLPNVGLWVAPPIRSAVITTDNTRKYSIAPDSYTLKSLIAEINKNINASFKLGVNKKDNRAWVSKNKDEVRIRFDVDIAKILGFNSREWITLGTEKMQSTYQFGPHQDLSMLHIYSNVVKESYMGEFTHQLLRIVNWNQARKNQNSILLVYDRPYFMPVKHMNLDTIQIEIRDNLNIPVEFFYTDEPVIAILEFREKKL